MHDAFRLIDADGDMHITPTDLRDIKTWAADDGSTDFLDKLIFQVEDMIRRADYNGDGDGERRAHACTAVRTSH